MSANTETTLGPPKGYTKCAKETCLRWKPDVIFWCTTCYTDGKRVAMMNGMPDWTPPIAAPAAHVERRKGQRWKCNDGPAFTLSFRVDERKEGAREIWEDTEGQRWVGWDITGCMTLLADAPPEPAKCGMPFLNGHACALNAGHDNACSMWRTEVAKSPPAQEAPKAAPVCGYGGGGAHAGQVLRRHFVVSVNPKRIETKSVCDHHYLVGEKAYRGERHYAGPERLPRPQLAADWVEDCLPESGR